MDILDELRHKCENFLTCYLDSIDDIAIREWKKTVVFDSADKFYKFSHCLGKDPQYNNGIYSLECDVPDTALCWRFELKKEKSDDYTSLKNYIAKKT